MHYHIYHVAYTSFLYNNTIIIMSFIIQFIFIIFLNK